MTETFVFGFIKIYLVDVACSSGGDKDKFWKIFDERLELCHRALLLRHKRRFVTIAGVTDKNYITNSYHVHVRLERTALKKAFFEIIYFIKFLSDMII